LRIQNLINKIKHLPQIKIIKRVLKTKNYNKYLTKCSAIIIPYDPSHYKIRLSGIAIASGALGIPVITTKQTWAGDMIKIKKLSGVIFSFSKDQNNFTKNIVKAIYQFLKYQKEYKTVAVKYSRYFRDNYSAKKYFKNYIFKIL